MYITTYPQKLAKQHDKHQTKKYLRLGYHKL